MEKKITKAQMFTFIKSITDTLEIEQFGDGSITDEMVDDFLTHELELLAKKSANKKLTKTQTENLVLMDKVVNALALCPNGATASELLCCTSDDFVGMSTQKMSAILKMCVEAGRVVKTKEKKKSIFSVAV